MVLRDGTFPAGYADLVPRVLSGAISQAAIRRELSAQVERVVEAGIHPSHIDGHQHVHLLPRVWPVVLELAKRFSIPWIRIPKFRPVAEGSPSAYVTGFRLGLNTLQSWRRTGLGSRRSPDLTPALGLSGHLATETILHAVRGLPSGTVAELVTHPGISSSQPEVPLRLGI